MAIRLAMVMSIEPPRALGKLQLMAHRGAQD
jgi:hypothetical protein